ncbi:MAG: MFS transporter, partial [Rhodobacteraceae bacterium]|nr:MFS transporter [Paracoccaceae bacterium]
MARLDQKWTVLAITGIAVVLSLTTWFSVTAILSELVADRKLSVGQAAWMTNAVQLGFVMGALASSLVSLADIMSLTRLMAMASLLAAGFNAVPLIEPSVGGLIAGRFATGVALAAIYPPSLKFVATWFRTGRGLAMGTMVGALSLGSALPHLVRATNTTVSWQPVIAASSLASLAAAALFAFALREGPYRFARTRVDPRQIGAILRDRPLMLANAGYFGHMWELYAMWAWLLTYVGAAQANGLSLAAPSLLVFAV